MSTKTQAILLAIMIIGLIVRGFNHSNFRFGFDQIQMLENASTISSGKLMLIGPRTGPAPLFTGPLVYYVTALAYYLSPSSHAIIGYKIITTLIIAGGLYWLISLSLSAKLRLLSMFLWSMSTYLVIFDHNPWNPNYTYLAAAFAFFPLYHLILRNQLKLWHLVAFFLASLLGFQAHFSGLLIPVLVSIVWIFLPRRDIKIMIMTWLGLFCTLLPVLIFDLRHDWLHVKGIQALLFSNDSGTQIPILNHFLQNLLITLENSGKLLFYDVNRTVHISIGIILLIASLLMSKNHPLPSSILLPWTWVGLVAFFLSLYPQPSPEYYFLVQIPALIVIIGHVLLSLPKQKLLLPITVTLIAFINAQHLVDLIRNSHALHFQSQATAANYITARSLTEPISRIEYDMPYSDDWGLRYLLANNNTIPSGSVVVISYPVNQDNITSYDLVVANGLGVKFVKQ
jgi:hypothetical protein